MYRKLFAVVTVGVIIICGVAEAAIISIQTGVSVTGNHASNIVVNGSFETRAVGDLPVPNPVYWTGVAGFHSENTLIAPVYSIPGWSSTSGIGGYGSWGQSSLLSAPPCADGVACLYFGNYVTVPSSVPIFNSDGTVSFASPPVFTNVKVDNQIPTVLTQTLGNLTVGASYLLDFWTTGEHYAAPFPDPGVFGLSIGSNSVFLTTPSINSVFKADSIRYYVNFIADSTSEPISFINWGHIGTAERTTHTELVIDDVIVNRIPEPSAIFLVGIGVIGLCLTRRLATA